MQYENPQVDTSVNVSKEHPLKEFSQLIIGVGLACLIIVVLLSWASERLVKYIPFAYETSMVSNMDFFEIQDSPTADELQVLADRLSKHMGLEEGMTLTLHYSNDDTVNAFATLGGNVVFFKGLLEKIESEQELAAVMAHEIAHIKLRHPIAALGKGVSLAAFATFVSGFSGNSAGEWLLGSSAQLTFMQYSRDQELAADLLAAKAIYAEYGHIGGAQQLFKRFEELESQSLSSKFTVEALRSHPYSKDRWQQLKEYAQSQRWPLSGQLTDMPLKPL